MRRRTISLLMLPIFFSGCPSGSPTQTRLVSPRPSSEVLTESLPVEGPADIPARENVRVARTPDDLENYLTRIESHREDLLDHMDLIDRYLKEDDSDFDAGVQWVDFTDEFRARDRELSDWALESADQQTRLHLEEIREDVSHMLDAAVVARTGSPEEFQRWEESYEQHVRDFRQKFLTDEDSEPISESRIARSPEKLEECLSKVEEHRQDLLNHRHLLEDDSDLVALANWGDFARRFNARDRELSDWTLESADREASIYLAEIRGDVQNMFFAVASSRPKPEEFQRWEKSYEQHVLEFREKFLADEDSEVLDPMDEVDESALAQERETQAERKLDLARRLDNQGNRAGARKFYQQVIDEYPNTNAADEAAKLLKP